MRSNFKMNFVLNCQYFCMHFFGLFLAGNVFAAKQDSVGALITKVAQTEHYNCILMQIQCK